MVHQVVATAMETSEKVLDDVISINTLTFFAWPQDIGLGLSMPLVTIWMWQCKNILVTSDFGIVTTFEQECCLHSNVWNPSIASL